MASTEAVLENTEKALDSIEARLDDIDGIVDVVEAVRNNPVTLAFVGIVGLTVGAVGGYFFAARRLTKQFDEQMVVEIAEAREFYANLNKVDADGTVLTPQDVLAARHGEEAVAAVRQYQGRVEAPAPTEADLIAEAKDEQGHPSDEAMDEAQMRKIEEKLETHNVFVDPGFDLEEEQKYRTEDKPYIITHDEFYAAERDYETSTLTYYEMDDTLTDERDQPLEEVDETIGEDHLVRFGSGSKDPNILYIRNDRLGTDYEVVKSSGSFLEEVLGMPEENPGELKHSDQRDRRRALRHGDG